MSALEKVSITLLTLVKIVRSEFRENILFRDTMSFSMKNCICSICHLDLKLFNCFIHSSIWLLLYILLEKCYLTLFENLST